VQQLEFVRDRRRPAAVAQAQRWAQPARAAHRHRRRDWRGRAAPSTRARRSRWREPGASRQERLRQQPELRQELRGSTSHAQRQPRAQGPVPARPDGERRHVVLPSTNGACVYPPDLPLDCSSSSPHPGVPEHRGRRRRRCRHGLIKVGTTSCVPPNSEVCGNPLRLGDRQYLSGRQQQPQDGLLRLHQRLLPVRQRQRVPPQN